MNTTHTAIAAYQAAIKAHEATDTHLSALLTAKYGKRAGDMRYRAPETVEIANAMRANLAASEAQQTAWLATMPDARPAFERYRLPDGRVVSVDATASKSRPTIGFTLPGGEIVQAQWVDATPIVK